MAHYHIRDFVDLPNEINRTKVCGVLRDLDLALALTAAAADDSRGLDVRIRKLRNAEIALLQIRSYLLPICTPDASNMVEINAKIGELEWRLKELQGHFASSFLHRQYGM
jgi:hypothetical protein